MILGGFGVLGVCVGGYGRRFGYVDMLFEGVVK